VCHAVADDPEAREAALWVEDKLDALEAKGPGNPTGTNQHTVEGGTVDNVNNSRDRESPTGNARQYALRRLKKSRPDLHARVLAGELSPNKAMVEAGFRRKMIQVPFDPERAAVNQ